MNIKLLKPIQLLYSGLFLLLFSTSTHAQKSPDPLIYNWEWALNGGGNLGSGGFTYQVEQIFDIAIDSQNNYYFLANITNGSPRLDGEPVTVYGNHMGGNDIFIFSTTCEGKVRWSQAIGGEGLFDAAYKLALDSKDNVYVGTYVGNGYEPEFPTHFSPNDSLPSYPFDPTTIHDAYKRSYIAKYNNKGVFQWKKSPQGGVNLYTYDSTIQNILIDSEDKIHFMVGLSEGTHLDGLVTVPKGKYQYFLVKLDSNTQLIEKAVLLPTEGYFVQPSIQFKFDEKLNRYYVGGFRSWINVFEDVALSYQGSAFTKNAYILAFDADTTKEIWRREMDSEDTDDCRIYDLDIDSNGDVYIGGSLYRRTFANGGATIKIYNPKKPSDNPFAFKIDIVGNMPFIAKLNSDGEAQWARTPSGYNWDTAKTGLYDAYKIAINGDEVALAANGSNTIWDDFEINRPLNHKLDPLLVRFNKKTGVVVGMHDILGVAGNNQRMTLVEADNDGNYVVGGAMDGSIFMDNVNGIKQLYREGNYDFYVAKLAAGPCGTNLSTDDFNQFGLQVYPNPTNDIVNIETSESLKDYVVYNILGQQLQSGVFNAGNTQIDMQNLASGTYFITINTQQKNSATVKVVRR